MADVSIVYVSNALNTIFQLIKDIINELYGINIHIYGTFISFPTLIFGFIFLSGLVAIFWKGLRG